MDGYLQQCYDSPRIHPNQQNEGTKMKGRGYFLNMNTFEKLIFSHEDQVHSQPLTLIHTPC